MLRLTKNIHSTGNIFVLDSGLCVQRGLVYIKNNGVYGTVLIKKRWHYQRYIDGEKIKYPFIDK